MTPYLAFMSSHDGTGSIKVAISRTLYGMYHFSHPREAVEMVSPLFAMADREMMLVMSLNTKLEPMAVEIVAVGGLNAE